jgi:o-succinylbenzoate synthase
MFYKASFQKQTFIFKQPSGTSRGILTEKHAWFINLHSSIRHSSLVTHHSSLGECSIIPGLSPDFIDMQSYETKLTEVCENINYYIANLSELEEFPSILFGVETALLALNSKQKDLLFDTSFSRGEVGIPINGLIWMGSKDFMLQQIEEKLKAGFSCLKMKIGAIDFDTEIKILASIRAKYCAEQIELRVDANGAFSPNEAMEKLTRLAEFDIHSIEQPIKAGQYIEMAELCSKTPLPIALDEELIGVIGEKKKLQLLKKIKPQYIIFKPSLHGGLYGVSQWIRIANSLNIPWWITSALESNVGLNCIAQFASTFKTSLPQGLGTGGLYENNTPANLTIVKGFIWNRFT